MVKFNSEQLQKKLFKRTEGYAANVREIYRVYMNQLINLVKGTELEDGKPFSFSGYGYGDQATAIFREMYTRLYQEIRGDVENEWILSNNYNDDLVKSVFGAKAIASNQFARYFKRNKEAMDSFLARRTGKEGLNLSQKVWKYTKQFKEELENCLDLAIGEGTGANKLASKIQKYLQDPDRFYRRFRVKVGEDESGNTIYGRQWKRRIYDKESQGYKWIDDEPKNYHPGQGVYRSSYRNAQRLARTETNIAYRTADLERWEQLDFVIGYEIKVSKNHPHYDICDELAGKYPKDFVWTGWHPNCRCFMIPILAGGDDIEEMIERIMAGDGGEVRQKEKITEFPGAFNKWIKENEDRMDKAKAKAKGTLPYFIKDNSKAIEKILHPFKPK